MKILQQVVLWASVTKKLEKMSFQLYEIKTNYDY